MNQPTSTRISRFVAPRRAILTIVATVLIVIGTLYSVLFTGSTSRTVPTGSLTAVRALVSEDLRLQGVRASQVTIDVARSAADDHWALFVLTPKLHAPSNLQRTYGFMIFRSHQWQLVATGDHHVGCASATSRAVVPLAIVHSLGQRC